MMYDYHVPVLIVGGGPVGLATSLFLTRAGVSSFLVERHATTTVHPRARGMNIRTMEVFRNVGLAEAMRSSGSIVDTERYTLSVETLAGKELQRILPQGSTENYEYTNKLSPEGWCLCAQDNLEPLLVAAAREQGVDLHFSTELVSFEQDATGVTAKIAQLPDRTMKTVRADYLIAADGAHSRIRKALDIQLLGKGILAYYINIYFRADLREMVQDRLFIMCHVENPKARGIFFTVNDTDRWLFNVSYEPAKGESPEDFTNERCIDIVRKAVGIPDFPIEILNVLPWESATCIADTFSQGRILLVGDAAHIMPPFGASGVNIGVQDAHNLAWKLAAVLKGEAGSVLLATYQEERKTVGDITLAQADFRHKGIMLRSSEDDIRKASPSFKELIKVMLGYHYTSLAVIPEAGASPTDELVFDGRPGTRAPHLWIEQQGKRLSILDVFGQHFVLLTSEAGTAWQDAAQVVSQRLGLPLDVYRVGKIGDLLEQDGQWTASYGVTSEGAVLVRPDGFVAWRSRGQDAAAQQVLEHVLTQVLAR